MVITVREILQSDFFKDYKVLAGHNGLDNIVRGITVLDSESGYKWVQGNEFIFTTGYIFTIEPENLERYLNSQEIKKHAALGIKTRYFKEVPRKMLEIFNNYNIPLVNIPPNERWVEIFNAINTVIMNKSIKKFDIGKIGNLNIYNFPYQERKIKKILNTFEFETSFPSMLYDLVYEKAYFSSNKFKEQTTFIKKEEFWNPSINYSKEYLFDSNKMARYKLYSEKDEHIFNWITIPITIEDKTKAYFVIIESAGKMNYFDEFTLGIALAQLQAMYEQILAVKGLEDIQFTNFINKLISGDIGDKENILTKAVQFDINIYKKYYFFVMRQNNKDIFLKEYKDIIFFNKKRSFESDFCYMVYVDDDKLFFLYELNGSNIIEKELKILYEKIDNFSKRLQLEIKNIKVNFGFSDLCGNIFDTEKNYKRCLKSLNIGPLLYPDSLLWTYSELGAFAWLDINHEELDIMKKDIDILYSCDEDNDLIETLRTYIENNMNFSLTAKKLFIHINTVRNRIEKINNLINIDLNDEISRLKLEILLKLL
jgi:purine catabolism regulator